MDPKLMEQPVQYVWTPTNCPPTCADAGLPVVIETVEAAPASSNGPSKLRCSAYHTAADCTS